MAAKPTKKRRHTGPVINGEDVIDHFKICERQIADIRQMIRYLPLLAKKLEPISYKGRFLHAGRDDTGPTAMFPVGPVGLMVE